jgi:hypothetical protein
MYSERDLSPNNNDGDGVDLSPISTVRRVELEKCL